MKIEQLIVRYLYKNKKVTLQDIGTFTVSPDIIIPTENDKDTLLPPDAITFVCDPKALPDSGLVNYIMEHTRKIRPLAASDLESFSMLNTQFLNIGKPLILEGVGTLQKTQAGDYAFTQAGSSHLIYEETPKLVTEKQNEEISFASPRREKSNGGGKTAIGVIIFLLLAAAAVAIYYFMQHRDKAADNDTVQTTDSLSNNLSADSISLKHKADSIAALPAVKDSNSFYVVIKEYNTLTAAQKSFEKLKSYGHNVILVPIDTGRINQIQMPFKRPLSDTLHIKDSISKFFKTKAYVIVPDGISVL